MSVNRNWNLGAWTLALGMLAPLSVSAAGDTGTGTQPGEYQAAKPGAAVKGAATGSTAEIGTQPEEYGSPAKPKQKDRVVGTPGSAASVKAHQKPPAGPVPAATMIHGDIPGLHPSEASKDTTHRMHPFDTVHNVRIRKDTPHPDSVKPR